MADDDKFDEQVFVQADPMTGAYLPFLEDVGRAHIARRYLEAAETIVENESPRTFRHAFFFPVCLLCRHSLELILKSAIEETWRLNGETKSGREVIKTEHALGSLWDRLVHHELREASLDMGGEFDGPVERVVQAFDEIDPNGERFRYAKMKDGFDGLEMVDFENRSLDLVALVERVRKAFHQINAGVATAVSQKLEMLERGY